MKNKMYKKLVLAMACLLLVISMAACGSNSSPSDTSNNKEPVKIGMISFLSGAGAPWANSLKSAAEMAVDEINENGGVLGRPVELILNDSKSDPATGNVLAKTLVNKDKVAALFTADMSSVRNALYPVVKEAELPFFYMNQYEGNEYLKYMYVNAAVPKQFMYPVVPYMTEKFKAQKWFILGSDYVYPRSTGDAVKEAIKNAGGTVVGEEFAPLGTSDFSSIIAKIKSSQPDVIAEIVIGPDAVSFQKQLNTQGLNKNLKIVTVAVEESSVGAMGSSAEGIFPTGEYFQSIPSPENQEFIKKHKAKFGENADLPTFISIGTYEAIHMWALAVNKANSLEWEKLNEVIFDVTFNGPRGPIQYERETNHVNLPVYLAQVVNGKLEVVESFGKIAPTGEAAK